MAYSAQAFCEWLSATPISTTIKTVDWLIPTIQTIHILSISVMMGATTVVNLRALGLCLYNEPLSAVAHRFLPWIWWSLCMLFSSGSMLIVGEPARSLPNPAFVLKMSMLAVAAVLTLTLQRSLQRDAQFWERSASRRVGGRLLATISLLFWVGIVFAGRWIAYIDVDAG